MATEIQKLDKRELAERYERAKQSIKRARAQGKVVVTRTTSLVMSGAGGFAAGMVDHRIPEIAGLPTSATVGLALGILGVVDAAGDASDSLLAFGSGMLAGAAHEQGRKFSQGLNL